MKAYTNYRVALFIGLLSFNTLSACVHTRQTLGANNRRHDNSRCCPHLSKPAKRYLTAGFLLLFGGPFICFLIHSIRNHGMVPSTNNGSNPATFAPSMPPDGTITMTPFYNITPEEVENITKAIEGKEEWSSTTPKESSSSTTQKSGDDVTKDMNPMVLEKSILEDILHTTSSKERIQYWLDNGLNIDAKDEEGKTLLIISTISKKMSVMEFLIGKKADVNAKNKNGQTALMFAGHMHLDLDMVEFLIKHGADPCIKNNNGLDLRSLLSTESDKDLDGSKAIIKYLDEAVAELHPETKKCPKV